MSEPYSGGPVRTTGGVSAEAAGPAFRIRLLLEQPHQGESSHILARAKLRAVTERMGFNGVQRERAELVCTEVLTNQQKYGRGGLLQLWETRLPEPALEIFAIDYGPGLTDPERAFEDGFTTSGTMGRGLGAVRRLADDAGVYSVPDDGQPDRPWHGVAVWARFCPGGRGAVPIQVGGFLRAYNDAVHNGDLIAGRMDDERLRWLHMDGLGHGREAAEAVEGLETVFERADGGPDAVLERVSRGLRGGRGAVGIAGELDARAGHARLCGVGDMTAAVVDTEKRAIPFSPGVLGHAHRSFTAQEVAVGGSTVVLTASDGIRRKWDGHTFPGLWDQHPQLVALLIGNVLGRTNDDKSVLVARLARL